jgi:hypothetical protein
VPQDTPNINAIMPTWFPGAMRAVERLFTACGPPLAARLAHTAARLSQMNGAASIAGALSAMVATPGLALLEALRADYGIGVADPHVETIGEAALALYFALRVQDDIVDEPAQLDRAYIYVAEVFSGASQRAFAQALAGSPRFFAFREEIMAVFVSAATWEVDVFCTGVATKADLVRMGQKLLPIAIPLGALALLAGRPAQLEPLVQFTTHFGIGLQMVNDLLNVKEDHMKQRLTPVLSWLYAEGKVTPDAPPTTMRLALLADAVLPRALACAQEAIGQAEQTALAMQAPRLAAIANNRAVYVQSVPHRLLALHCHMEER